MADQHSGGPKYGFWTSKHGYIERNVTLLAVLSLIVVAVGGLVQIVPLFYLENTIEDVEGVRPYTPLELAGRDIYIREGCYVCHSQMIRPMRDEFERYGHYSLAAESKYDHPFQWGSKRTGPDLARVGGRYSDDWHVRHMINPQSMVPESIMPGYAFLIEREIDGRHIADLLRTHRLVGVPYTDEMIDNAVADFRAQADPEADFDAADALEARYFAAAYPSWDANAEADPPIVVPARNFDSRPELTEMDAVIAYLQVLGTMVDFSTYTPDESR
ncbi:MAG: cytochrome-c oxidase, cbb3-type subunit II [Rhodobacteraceae bacterium]|jgi:cytochrome c oxidase cbb3-type subunit 2|nr:cytochrome-c oxidase, cbb3-type subunit II [Paracoccaceae bacterium]MBL4557331.1 cytochrome-c oxidase, cbb3-type subunit II [Paracoccaceae bacterium]HBG97494.1 cytochrome-c oxidase, cbb3-type subunit II [Paracoccaceae bacterium]